MLENVNWAEVFFYLLTVAVLGGIAKQKIDDLRERVKYLEDGQTNLKDNHQKIELHVVNVPTKEDFSKLTGEIGQLKLSLQKLDLTLDFMARAQGFGKPNHTET